MSRNIPFIHNYCDRWCERCNFTDRCAVFEMNQDGPPEAEDPGNEAFWQTLSARFAETHRILEEQAGKWGLVIEEPTPEEIAACAQHEESEMERMDRHPLIEAARRYGDSVGTLFSHSGIWEQKGQDLARETTLGIKTVQKGLDEADLLADCRHVLGWYQHFIEIKFRRALGGLDEIEDLQSDANGSAKVALLAVERSRLALTTLLSLVGEDDGVLDLLALLERIGKEGRAAFPDAERFRRPGFDEQS